MAPKQTKKEDQGKKPNEKKEALVMKYRLWAKSALAPYPAEDGSPLYTGDLEAEEFLGEKRIAESRNATNCEWLLRPGMALSFYAAAVRVGWKELKAAGKDNEKVEAMMKANAAFTGALKVLDVGKSKAPDRKDIKASVSTLVDFLQGISEADRASICKLALRAAKLYLMCMHLLEAMDLVRNPKLFAKKMSKAVGSNKTTEEALSWMKHPEDTKRLKEMLNKALQKKVSKHQALAGTEKKRRRSTASSGSAGAASAATASEKTPRMPAAGADASAGSEALPALPGPRRQTRATRRTRRQRRTTRRQRRSTRRRTKKTSTRRRKRSEAREEVALRQAARARGHRRRKGIRTRNWTRKDPDPPRARTRTRQRRRSEARGVLGLRPPARTRTPRSRSRRTRRTRREKRGDPALHPAARTRTPQSQRTAGSR